MSLFLQRKGIKSASRMSIPKKEGIKCKIIIYMATFPGSIWRKSLRRSLMTKSIFWVQPLMWGKSAMKKQRVSSSVEGQSPLVGISAVAEEGCYHSTGQ
ncbi:hypothetical protein GDO81_019494 [Engystomops pustulosus]|uniref:Uncharacterized protein n=1 Tax=Engystomops pustulosus TaxID=76066 RepID=A0AAV6YW24_ENGPU|nr:hypothetical protein GDO81_019494 [Engystomops pustulosus]